MKPRIDFDRSRFRSHKYLAEAVGRIITYRGVRGAFSLQASNIMLIRSRGTLDPLDTQDDIIIIVATKRSSTVLGRASFAESGQPLSLSIYIYIDPCVRGPGARNRGPRLISSLRFMPLSPITVFVWPPFN